MSDTTNDRSFHLFCAQELNNSAAMCFEKGLPELATTSLHNGLKILIAMNHGENNNDESGAAPTVCSGCCGICPSGSKHHSMWHSHCDHPCTLDRCIAFSEQTSFLIHSGGNNDSSSSPEKVLERTFSNSTTTNNAATAPNKKRRLSHSRDVASGLPTITTARNKGYVYQKPIRVPLEGFCHCRRGYMSLLVVIVFNLAIAHHLNAMEEGTSDIVKTQNIVFLYRLCLDLLHQASSSSLGTSFSSSELSESTTGKTASSAKTSIRCEMILKNNLSQLYLLSGKSTKHQESLQDLLSTLMVVIEQGTRSDSTSGNTSGSSRGIGDYWWDSNRTQTNGKLSELIEGVLTNLDPLIRQDQCADAA